MLPSDPRHALPLSDAALFSPARAALDSQLYASLRALGGSASPRACGVTPWDAGWASQNSGGGSECLKCSSAGEVWTLLLTSERLHKAAREAAASVAADATAAVTPAAAPCLLLRQWVPDMRAEGEVHCRVRCSSSGERSMQCIVRGSGAVPSQALQASIDAFMAQPFLDWRAATGGAQDYLVHLYLPLACRGGQCNGVRILDITPLQQVAAQCSAAPPAEAAGEAGSGGEEGGQHPGIHFHPWAAHAFPEEVFHYAAERMCASTVGAVGGGLDGPPAGGLVTELAQEHAKEGVFSSGGWAHFVEALHAKGAFRLPGEEGDSSSEEEGEGKCGAVGTAGGGAK
jgi:hypothetical protein